jgi:hypothetical protein
MDFHASQGRENPAKERLERTVDFFEISVDGPSGGEHFRGLSFFHALCVGEWNSSFNSLC